MLPRRPTHALKLCADANAIVSEFLFTSLQFCFLSLCTGRSGFFSSMCSVIFLFAYFSVLFIRAPCCRMLVVCLFCLTYDPPPPSMQEEGQGFLQCFVRGCIFSYFTHILLFSCFYITSQSFSSHQEEKGTGFSSISITKIFVFICIFFSCILFYFPHTNALLPAFSPVITLSLPFLAMQGGDICPSSMDSVTGFLYICFIFPPSYFRGTSAALRAALLSSCKKGVDFPSRGSVSQVLLLFLSPCVHFIRTRTLSVLFYISSI